MRAHTITSTKLALLLSLLAVGALGLVACGGGGDEDSATEAKVSADTTTEATGPRDTTTEAKLSREQAQELKREANTWASLFADTVCTKYEGQPMCQRLLCVLSPSGPPIENCTPVSAAFQESFADATVEDIKFQGVVQVGWTDHPVSYAAIKFSNGEVVVFNGGGDWYSCAGGGSGCTWSIAEPDHNRRFLEAAAPRG